MALVPSFLQIVQSWRRAMHAPVFQAFLTLLTGWVFAPPRTITEMLVVAGVAGQRHHAAFHRLFSSSCGRSGIQELVHSGTSRPRSFQFCTCRSLTKHV